MQKVNWHFSRQALAHDYLKTVYQGAVNRIALLDVRRTGKTSFLLKDFFPEALDNGFTPVYVNLWLEPENPALSIVSAIEQTISVVRQGKTSTLTNIAQTQIQKLEIGNSLLGKVALDFSPSNATPANQNLLTAINTSLADLVSLAGDKIVLIIDEIQHLASLDMFDNIQRALRTALDTHSQINVVYSGSSRSGIDAMFKDKDKAFFNSAFIIDFPRLDRGFVINGRDILKKHFDLSYSETELYDYYQKLDQSPFWFMQLLNYLLVHKAGLGAGIDYINQSIIEDGQFDTLKKSLNKTDETLLLYISDGGVSLYSEQSRSFFKKRTGKEATPSSIQGSLKKLITKNIISKYNNKFYIELPGFISYLTAK